MNIEEDKSLDDNQGKKEEEVKPVEQTDAAAPAEAPIIEETKAEEKEAEAVAELGKEQDKDQAHDELKEEVQPELKPEPKVELKPEDRKWYVIQTYTGQEDKVRENLEKVVKDKDVGDRIPRVLVPTEEIVELKNGKRVEKVRKMFPGYVFIEMYLDDYTWYIIRGTPGVAKFIGTKTMPSPVADREMQRVLRQLGEEKKFEITFEKGESVRIISGPFRGYTGSIDEVSADKGKLKILVSIFGRDTPVEVNFEHAEKII